MAKVGFLGGRKSGDTGIASDFLTQEGILFKHVYTVPSTVRQAIVDIDTFASAGAYVLPASTSLPPQWNIAPPDNATAFSKFYPLSRNSRIVWGDANEGSSSVRSSLKLGTGDKVYSTMDHTASECSILITGEEFDLEPSARRMGILGNRTGASAGAVGDVGYPGAVTKIVVYKVPESAKHAVVDIHYYGNIAHAPLIGTAADNARAVGFSNREVGANADDTHWINKCVPLGPGDTIFMNPSTASSTCLVLGIEEPA